MSATDPYVTVRRAIVDDETFGPIWDEPAALGWWLKFRLAADAAYPATAEILNGCPAEMVTLLESSGAIARYPRGRFRMIDYDLERESRSRAASRGGVARAEQAARASTGRFKRVQPANAGTSEGQPLNASPPSTHPVSPPLAASGSAASERPMTEALRRRNGNVTYVPVAVESGH